MTQAKTSESSQWLKGDDSPPFLSKCFWFQKDPTHMKLPVSLNESILTV